MASMLAVEQEESGRMEVPSAKVTEGRRVVLRYRRSGGCKAESV